MGTPFPFGPVLSLVGSLFGAKKSSDASKRADWNNSPQGIRANAEEAGFNPLAFVGPGTGTGAGYAPQMGSIIANGFAAAADQWTNEKQLQLQKAQLEQENERLKKLSEKTILTPKVGGIYARKPNNANLGAAANPVAAAAGFAASQHDPENDYKGRDFGLIAASGAGQTSVASNPGYVEEITKFYGDDVSDIEGALNYGRDWWFGRVKGDPYIPGWGWESTIKRPKARPESVEELAARKRDQAARPSRKREKPRKKSTDFKQRYPYLKNLNPSVYD